MLMRRGAWFRLGLPGALLVLGAGCTDAATRLANDITSGAAELRRSGQREATIVHRPRPSPEGCSSSSEIVLRKGVRGPDPLSLLSVGCVGSPNYESLGYDYFTTTHLNAVHVPSELRILKASVDPVMVTLRQDAESINVIGLR